HLTVAEVDEQRSSPPTSSPTMRLAPPSLTRRFGLKHARRADEDTDAFRARKYSLTEANHSGYLVVCARFHQKGVQQIELIRRHEIPVIKHLFQAKWVHTPDCSSPWERLELRHRRNDGGSCRQGRSERISPGIRLFTAVHASWATLGGTDELRMPRRKRNPG